MIVNVGITQLLAILSCRYFRVVGHFDWLTHCWVDCWWKLPVVVLPPKKTIITTTTKHVHILHIVFYIRFLKPRKCWMNKDACVERGEVFEVMRLLRDVSNGNKKCRQGERWTDGEIRHSIPHIWSMCPYSTQQCSCTVLKADG